MTTLWQQVSDALAATVAAISPGIVCVAARHRLSASGIVWSADGVIVTAHHTIEQDEGMRVGLHSGQTVPATLIGRDATIDLAVLRVASVDLAPPAVGVGQAGVEGDRFCVVVEGGLLVAGVLEGRPTAIVQPGQARPATPAGRVPRAAVPDTAGAPGRSRRPASPACDALRVIGLSGPPATPGTSGTARGLPLCPGPGHRRHRVPPASA